MEFEGEVTVNDPPRAHSIIMTDKEFDLQVDYTFKCVQGLTEVIQSSLVVPRCVVKVFISLFGWMMKGSGCREAQEELENLKRLLKQPENTS